MKMTETVDSSGKPASTDNWSFKMALISRIYANKQEALWQNAGMFYSMPIFWSHWTSTAALLPLTEHYYCIWTMGQASKKPLVFSLCDCIKHFSDGVYISATCFKSNKMKTECIFINYTLHCSHKKRIKQGMLDWQVTHQWSAVLLSSNQNLILSLRFHNRTNQRMKSWWPQLSLPVSVHPKKDSEYRYLRSMMIFIFCSLFFTYENLGGLEAEFSLG